MVPTQGEMIDEISRKLPQPFTRKQLIDTIVKKHGKIRPKNREPLETDIAGCCVNLDSHRSLPDLPLILVSIGRGRCRRYNPRADRELNRYIEQGYGDLETEKRTNLTMKKEQNLSPRATVYEYNSGARSVLEKARLIEETEQIIRDIQKVDHKHIQDLFSSRGWSVEHQIHPNVNWAWDAYKSRVPVSIELSLIDAVHRDFSSSPLGARR